MKYAHLYIEVRELLTNNPAYRDSDKKLLWAVWEKESHVFMNRLSYGDFMSHSLTSAETVTRTRRKLQELYPDLRASITVQNFRNHKRKSKGTFIYREPIKYKFESGVAVPVDKDLK